ncbi:hypothetical protein GCM10023347_51200 [Streptomyces chumphonensis]
MLSMMRRPVPGPVPSASRARAALNRTVVRVNGGDAVPQPGAVVPGRTRRYPVGRVFQAVAVITATRGAAMAA